jgi:hypothetical protein
MKAIIKTRMPIIMAKMTVMAAKMAVQPMNLKTNIAMKPAVMPKIARPLAAAMSAGIPRQTQTIAVHAITHVVRVKFAKIANVLKYKQVNVVKTK